MHQGNFKSLRLLTLAILGISYSSVAVAEVAVDSGSSPSVSRPAQAKAPRIRVDGFDLVRFKEAPEQGWTKAKVADFLASQLKAHDNQFTLKELEMLAREMTIMMKRSGLMFSRVLLEDQEIKDNRVSLYFEDGVLGEVVVMNAQRTTPKLLARPFIPYLQHTAVRQDLDKALYQLDKLPGLDVFGFFSMSETPGLSRLNLKVTQEKDWNALIYTDNYGNDATGEEQIHGTFELLNPTGWGDLLKLNAGRSFDQPGVFDGYAQYSIPVGKHYQPLTFMISNSDFELGQGFEDLEIFGRSTMASINYRHQFDFSSGSISLLSGIYGSKSKIDSRFYSDAFFRDSRVQAARLGFLYSNLLFGRVTHSLRVEGIYGDSDETNVIGDAGEVVLNTRYAALDSSYQLHWYHDDADRARHTIASFEFYGSGDVLPAVEQKGFGGYRGIRGLDSGYFSADQSVMLHFDHDFGLWPSSWPGIVSFFADAGIGKRFASDNVISQSTAQTAEFASVGLGYTWQKAGFQLKYEFGQIVHAHLKDDLATPEEIDAFDNEQPSRHFLSLSYQLGEH